MNVTNKSNQALRVPLPGGRTLFLGIGATGQIGKRAAEHPPMLALVEAGELEIDESTRKRRAGNTHGPASRTGH